MTVAAPAGPLRLAGPRPPARRRRPPWTALAVLVPVAALGWLVLHWATVDRGTDTLATGSAAWLGLAAAVATFTWVAGAVCQQGAVLQPLPRIALLLVQVAGSLANHVLPSGIGVGAVNVRFLRRQGLTTGRAVAAVGVNTLAGICVHVLALAILIGTGSTPLHLASTSDVLLGVSVAAGLVLLPIAVPAARRRLGALARHTGEELRALRELRTRPARLWQLWLGSAAVPCLHAATLVCVGRSIGLSLGTAAVLGIYFVSSALAGLVPSPGGFGSLDAALTLAFVSAGVPTATAVATTIGYRVLTVWIPLLPSTAVFMILLRRRVI